jgi:hypothetical protein
MDQPSHAAITVYARVGFAPIGSVLHISHGRRAAGDETGPDAVVD